VGALTCTAAWAQSAGLPPVVGFPAGPFVVAPSLIAGYSYDSNVLLAPDDQSPSPDSVTTLQPALNLTIPFSNSAFRLGDTFRWVSYKKTPQEGGKTANDANADLTLRFGSLDSLEFAARSVKGVADTIVFDPGGEAQSLKGNPYRLHSESVAVYREDPEARGYRFAVTRNAFTMDRPIDFNYLDYRGFDGEIAYVQPLSPNTRLSFGYLGGRYDLYDISPGADPAAIFRTENGNSLYARIEGRLGPRQPYDVRVGWERLEYGVNAAPEGYSGLVANLKLSMIVGGGTSLSLIAQRQPYHSTAAENNYYLFDQVGGNVVRPFPRGSSLGGSLVVSRSTYALPIGGIYRADRSYVLELYASLAVQDRVHFRVSVLNNRRTSNYASADYNSLQVFGGFVIGWI
jgi:hypothetical protein